MLLRTNGVDPDDLVDQLKRRIVTEINQSATDLYRSLSNDTPVGVAGQLRQGWQLHLASMNDPEAAIAQSNPYFLALELGRKPGKGISADGQAEVAIWASRVLGATPSEARGFAYLLSRSYKERGRPARGFAGLARPGDPPKTPSDLNDIKPIKGGLISEAFKQLDARLNS